MRQAPSPGRCAPGLLSSLSELRLHGWDVQGNRVKMQAKHLACLVGHLSQKPIVGGLVESGWVLVLSGRLVQGRCRGTVGAWATWSCSPGEGK